MCQSAKNLAVNLIPVERDLAVQTWTSNRKPDGKVLATWLLDVYGSREMPQNPDLKASIKEMIFSPTQHCNVEAML